MLGDTSQAKAVQQVDPLDALRQLVEQIEKTAPTDDHGHLLTMNTAFIKAKELL